MLGPASFLIKNLQHSGQPQLDRWSKQADYSHQLYCIFKRYASASQCTVQHHYELAHYHIPLSQAPGRLLNQVFVLRVVRCWPGSTYTAWWSNRVLPCTTCMHPSWLCVWHGYKLLPVVIAASCQAEQ